MMLPKKKMNEKIWLEKPEERRTFRRRYVEGKITLKRVLNGMFWTGFISLRLGIFSGPSKHGNEPSV